MAHQKLSLPCLRGSIGDWNYYNVVMPFKELDRINNDHIIKEAKTLDRWLQRKLTNRRFKIQEYLLNDDERYFNSVIIGVYGDIPDWYALDLSLIQSKFKIDLGARVEDGLGVLSLSGKESLFTIDGQHRIDGIKLALKDDPKRFVDDELSVVMIAHKNDKIGRIRTRKLFATINREAVKPSSNDLAIIDEVYSFNVTARDLYAKYKNFKNKILLTENYDLDRNNHTHFTNLLSLVTVNKIIHKLVPGYNQSRYLGPNVKERESLYQESLGFWDFVIDNIDEYKKYFKGKLDLKNLRNVEKGMPLNLLFVPIGQKLMAEIYFTYKKKKKLDSLKGKINKLDFDLNKGHFTKLCYNPVKNTMVTNNQRLTKTLFFFLLGEKVDEVKLKIDLAKAYGINELSPEFKKFNLPNRL